jgi:hypothetical protein
MADSDAIATLVSYHKDFLALSGHYWNGLCIFVTRIIPEMSRFILLVLLMSTVVARAQEKTYAENNGGNPCIKHTIAEKQTYYSIAKQYNLKPEDIAKFNGVDMAKPLTNAATLKIPLNKTNLVQGAKPDGATPIYYTIQPKETMFKVGQMFGKAKPDVIRQMNGMTSDALSVGQELVVGYLKASGNSATVPATSTTPKPVVDTVAKSAKKETPKVNPNSGISNVIVGKPKKDSMPVVAKVEEKKPDNRPKGFVSTTGFFEGQFDASSGNATTVSGTGANFKSTSGWNDGKFYALMNNVTPGTIVKVTSGSKSIFAKVLGSMPDMKQNEGLVIRLSNAGAASLEAATDKFAVTVEFRQ